ncbi:MAG: hypothetical protein E7537_00765 [Ruminococcaceae bacterium]|nr:hypothetical protein [Oscillospiraceae bacterium]
MNFINCAKQATPELIRKSVVFWSQNSSQHIDTLLRSTNGTTAVLENDFKEQLKTFRQRFELFYNTFGQNTIPLSRYQEFLRVNSGFINLLERIKFEAFSGYPVLQQSVFHYIYEARYINAVFSAKSPNGNVLITLYFAPFLNQSFNCFYNQMYFWGIIGSMHPSLIMSNNAFYNAINGYSKEFLTNVTNSFNNLNFQLSSLKRPIKKSAISQIFEEFTYLNNNYLEFLKDIRKNSPKIFTTPMVTRLSSYFYGAVDHQIAEHKLVSEINENIAKYL